MAETRAEYGARLANQMMDAAAKLSGEDQAAVQIGAGIVLSAMAPIAAMPGEYDAGRLIRGACEYDADKGRFYLTCSIGELAQRIAAEGKGS